MDKTERLIAALILNGKNFVIKCTKIFSKELLQRHFDHRDRAGRQAHLKLTAGNGKGLFPDPSRRERFARRRFVVETSFEDVQHSICFRLFFER